MQYARMWECVYEGPTHSILYTSHTKTRENWIYNCDVRARQICYVMDILILYTTVHVSAAHKGNLKWLK
jgi:hypothetical protein